LGGGLPETSAAAPTQQLNPPPTPCLPWFCISLVQCQPHCRCAPNLPCLGDLGVQLSLHYPFSSLRHLCLPQPVSCQALAPGSQDGASPLRLRRTRTPEGLWGNCPRQRGGMAPPCSSPCWGRKELCRCADPEEG